MTDINQVMEARTEAGAAYEAAARAYVDAWIKLHGYDLACANGNVGVIDRTGFCGQPEVLGHNEFLRDVSTIHGRAVDRAMALHGQIIRSLRG